jgi:hypothetical protein
VRLSGGASTFSTVVKRHGVIYYLRLPETSLKVLSILTVRAFRDATIPRAISEAINAYSMAVAPESSLRNALTRSNMIFSYALSAIIAPATDCL